MVNQAIIIYSLIIALMVLIIVQAVKEKKPYMLPIPVIMLIGFSLGLLRILEILP